MAVQIIKAVVQIGLLAYFLYYFYVSLAQSRSAGILKIVIVYVLAYVLSIFAGLTVLERVLDTLALPTVVFVCVLYQPELRRAFASGITLKRRFFRIGTSQTAADDIDSIITACQSLVQSKRGALLVFPRDVAVKSVIDTGTKINADISTALIVTVFEHDTPLHDGAMFIVGSKIVAAGCYLPLSAQTDIRQSFGTRHRAALGMAEESDAVVLIVSEETGAMSLAYNGSLYYNLDAEVIKNTLVALLNKIDVEIDKEEDKSNER